MLTSRLPRVFVSSQIRLWFKDCIDNPSAEVGFYLGLASIGSWLVAQFPQLVRNFRRKSADGLSPWFLAEWLMGDTLNLLGCLMTGDQLPSQTYTAVYFIAIDMAMIFQFVYYTLLNRDAVSLITADMRDPDVAYARIDPDNRDGGEGGRGGDGNGGGDAVESGRETGQPGTDRVSSPPPAGPGEWYSRRVGGNGGNGNRARTTNEALGGADRRRRARREARAAVGLAAATGVAAVVAVAIALALGLTTASRTGGVNLQPPTADAGAKLYGNTAVHTQLYGSNGDNNDDHDNNDDRRRHHADAGLPICGASSNPEWEVVVGRAVGYASSVFYLGSRLSQIYKNHSRRSCEGLAMSMFFTAACANIAYGLAILLRGGGNPTYLVNSIPWLLGSLGTVALDSTILAQARYYTKRAQRMRRVASVNGEGDGDAPEGEDELDRPLLRVE